mgnify:CR=1 FL=1
MTANPRVLTDSLGAPRHPQVGDVIVQTCVDEDGVQTHTGLVYKIELDNAMGPQRVLIEWATEEPSTYNRVWGYGGANIHNLRSEFQVIRQGVEIR